MKNEVKFLTALALLLFAALVAATYLLTHAEQRIEDLETELDTYLFAAQMAERPGNCPPAWDWMRSSQDGEPEVVICLPPTEEPQ